MAKNDNGLTPMMQQFFSLKAKHPDALLLFRCGDFYETYCDDAVDASRILGITLTKRNNSGTKPSTEMAGFPHHALDTYLPKLIRAGRRVAICDQLEDPKLTKKLVKRGITELVTPGVELQGEQFPCRHTLRQGILRSGVPRYFNRRVPHHRRTIRLCAEADRKFPAKGGAI